MCFICYILVSNVSKLHYVGYTLQYGLHIASISKKCKYIIYFLLISGNVKFTDTYSHIDSHIHTHVQCYIWKIKVSKKSHHTSRDQNLKSNLQTVFSKQAGVKMETRQHGTLNFYQSHQTKQLKHQMTCKFKVCSLFPFSF